MNQRAIWNRLLHWGFTAILTSTCVLGARYMQSAAADLDELDRLRRQALQSLRATQTQLAERRGRYTTESSSLQSDIQAALSAPGIKLLFPGLHPVPRASHAGLFLQLLPAQSEDG